MYWTSDYPFLHQALDEIRSRFAVAAPARCGWGSFPPAVFPPETVIPPALRPGCPLPFVLERLVIAAVGQRFQPQLIGKFIRYRAALMAHCRAAVTSPLIYRHHRPVWMLTHRSCHHWFKREVGSRKHRRFQGVGRFKLYDVGKQAARVSEPFIWQKAASAAAQRYITVTLCAPGTPAASDTAASSSGTRYIPISLPRRRRPVLLQRPAYQPRRFWQRPRNRSAAACYCRLFGGISNTGCS